MKQLDLILIPRDGFFFKDGRGWSRVSAGRGFSLDWPFPPTVRGALCSAYGRDWETRHQQELKQGKIGDDTWWANTKGVALDHMLAVRRPLGPDQSAWCRMWPAPADARFSNGAVQFLDPHPPNITTLGRGEANDPEERLWRPLPGQGKPETGSVWWPEQDFMAWLKTPTDAVPNPSQRKMGRLPRRLQAHVGIDSGTLASRQNVLFTSDVVETLVDGGPDGYCEWAIAVRIQFPEEISAETAVIFGGDGRSAWLEHTQPSLFNPPQELLAAFGSNQGLRLILVTPADFKKGWIPDGFERKGNCLRGNIPGVEVPLILRAAYVARPLHLSGWDMAAHAPRPTRRLVPPGSVYFLVKETGQSFTAEEARQLWLTGWGQGQSVGLGRCVPGIWHPEV